MGAGFCTMHTCVMGTAPSAYLATRRPCHLIGGQSGGQLETCPWEAEAREGQEVLPGFVPPLSGCLSPPLLNVPLGLLGPGAVLQATESSGGLVSAVCTHVKGTGPVAHPATLPTWPFSHEPIINKRGVTGEIALNCLEFNSLTRPISREERQ